MGIKEATHCISLISRGRIHSSDKGNLSSGLDEEHAKGFGAQIEGGNEIVM